MAKLSPIQTAFSAGELSPLMYNRSDTEGYQQGLSDLTNMFPDSRGPTYSRPGSRYFGEHAGNVGRVFSLPVDEQFFYSMGFFDLELAITNLSGHNPAKSYTDNSNFHNGNTSWTSGTDGHATSTVTFLPKHVAFHVETNPGRYAQVEQLTTGLTASTTYKATYEVVGDTPVSISVGELQGGSELVSEAPVSLSGEFTFTTPAGVTQVWVQIRVDSDGISPYDTEVSFLGIVDEAISPVTFVTPYVEADISELYAVISPSGAEVYVLHEAYPPYKLTYDASLDTFSWATVTFTGAPASWVAGNYPSCGDFFEGRLWLGGTIAEPQTFWGSKSGFPENFTAGVLADDGLEFTMAKFGRIRWMVGFKNLVIGTQNGEHIVTSEAGFISPGDIQVEQQSSYGSVGVQPQQVGDQIFYVSADRRKLRAIQYEWQKDNWLSKDLTFNSEHITRAGIKHIAWQQNPKNLFHCVLLDGTVASLTYERGHNVYGWSKVEWADGGGAVLDMAVGAVAGTDYVNILVKNRNNIINLEYQTPTGHTHYMDSWVDRQVEPDGVTVLGLDHLEGLTVQVLVDEAVHPDVVVTGNQITLQPQAIPPASAVVGIKFTPRMKTLPFDQGAVAGSGAPWTKRWNKIYVRIQESGIPIINGERTATRHAITPMNTAEANASQDVLMINQGFDKNAQIEVTQDLPIDLVVIGIFGELAQSIT